MDGQTVEIAAEDALAIVNKILPLLEQYGALAGPEGAMAAAAAGAAQLVVPALIRLGEQLTSKGLTTVEEQQATRDKYNGVLTMFGQPQWQPSTAGQEPTPPPQPS